MLTAHSLILQLLQLPPDTPVQTPDGLDTFLVRCADCVVITDIDPELDAAEGFEEALS